MLVTYIYEGYWFSCINLYPATLPHVSTVVDFCWALWCLLCKESDRLRITILGLLLFLFAFSCLIALHTIYRTIFSEGWGEHSFTINRDSIKLTPHGIPMNQGISQPSSEIFFLE